VSPAQRPGGVVPTLLLILDGWGIAPSGPGNAVSLAETPNLDALLEEHPSCRLRCSGRAVGLPEGFMGNSEVGHMNIGAGRVVYQDMTRIDLALERDELAANRVLGDMLGAAALSGGRLHLLGLLSDGGVHSHQNHLHALLSLAKAAGVEAVVHCFLDGRDTAPTSGAGYLEKLLGFMREIGWGRVGTVTGRYWAMDRDNHFERVERAWRAMVLGQGEPTADPVAAVRKAYEAGTTDEFVEPLVVRGPGGESAIADGDAVFFFNFRADRARQLCRVFFEGDFSEFDRVKTPRLAALASMTRYESTVPFPAAFEPDRPTGTLGEVVSGMGLRQLRIAETEKYAHVTYFLNCGREEPFPGEDRVLVPSPREVPTYDLKPAMSAPEVAQKLLERLGEYDLVVCNLANLDMVGHTGVIPAAMEAARTVDHCVGLLVEAMLERGGRVLLTADHGNAEEMLDARGGPQTAHSTNDVRLVLIEKERGRTALADGKLGDIAPTLLALWGAAPSAGMTGEVLIRPAQEVPRA
jgi:2,3-bisphosphoglycerate-independent phosphoglycerate mutase